MKQIVSSYSYSPTTNVVTLTGVNIDADQLLLIVAPEVGRTMYNFASVTGTVSAGANTRVTLNASTAGLTASSPLVIFYDDQASAQSVTGTVALDSASLTALENVTVTIGSSVSISNFPSTQTIAGTVTANVFGYGPGGVPIQPAYQDTNEIDLLRSKVFFGDADNSNENIEVSKNNPLPISGTITANVLGTKTFIDNNAVTVSGFLTVGGWDDVNGGYAPLRVNDGGTGIRAVPDPLDQTPFPIYGSVTVGANPSGALTTRFGSVTTASVAQLTSAVTNSSRKYLLLQNIATSTVTIGIGFAPTTTQGIQLTAGAGLTFDAFCPTGGVWWLSSTTGSNFSILEG